MKREAYVIPTTTKDGTPIPGTISYKAAEPGMITLRLPMEYLFKVTIDDTLIPESRNIGPWQSQYALGGNADKGVPPS